MARKRKKQEDEAPEKSRSLMDLFRRKPKGSETIEEALGPPETPYDIPGKSRTGWRPGPGGQLIPYAIVDAFLKCHKCDRLFGEERHLRHHMKLDHADE